MKALPRSARISIVAGVLSGILAVAIRPGLNEKPTVLAYLLVGFWALIPPIWFIIEWHQFKGTPDERDKLKHSQELARNVWVAMVIVLAKTVGISWPGKD